MASPTFVGRLEELQSLEAARVRAADGEPAVVLVGGEAGVGKTRLVAELTTRCAADGTQVLAGGCVPVGDGALPYAPIVEALATNGRLRTGYIGIGARAVGLTQSQVKDAKLDQHVALVVLSIDEGGPAHTAGMLIGDLVVAVSRSLRRNIDLHGRPN